MQTIRHASFAGSERGEFAACGEPSFALRASEGATLLRRVAETDESIVRASTRSPEGSCRYPRFTPGAGPVGCTDAHFPPAASEPFSQSSARRCMQVHGAPRRYPRDQPGASPPTPRNAVLDNQLKTALVRIDGSGHAQFQLFSERLESSRNAVDARAMTDIGQSRDLLRGRVQPTRQIGEAHPLAHHFIQ